MWIPPYLIMIFCCCGQSSAVNVTFKSHNLHNVLHWDQLNTSDQTVLYSVEFNEYGSGFQQKKECQNITALSCDLSQETHVRGHNDQYTARVKVGGKVIGQTTRFSPLRQTTLDAPDVTVTSKAAEMTVRVEVPEGPDGRSMTETLHRPPYYMITLTRNRSGEIMTRQYQNTSELFVFSNLEKDTEYCGSVTFNFDTMPRPPSEAFTFCEILPGDVEVTRFLFLPSVGIALLLLVMIPALLWCLLTRRKVAEPESLNFHDFTYPLLATHEKTDITRIELQPTVINPYNPYKKQGAISNFEGYAQQDIQQEQSCHCETYANQQVGQPEDSQASALSSPTYSTVMMQGIINSSEDESSPTNKGPGGSAFHAPDRPLAPFSNLIPHQSSEVADRGLHRPETGTPMLPTSQSPKGKLKLELSFLLHRPGMNGDLVPDEETSEGTALLSDQPEAEAIFVPRLSSITVGDSDSFEEKSVACSTNSYLSNELVPSPQGPTSYLPDRVHFCSGNLPSSYSPLATHEKTDITRIEPQPDKPKVVNPTPDKKQGAISKCEGYAPQDDHPEPSWHCETYANQQVGPPEDSQGSALSSPTYSTVVWAQVLNSSGDENSPTNEGLGDSAFPVSDRPLAPFSNLLPHQSREVADRGLHSPETGTPMLPTSQSPKDKLSFLLHHSGMNGDLGPDEETSECTALLSDQPEAEAIFVPRLSSITVGDSDSFEEKSVACSTNSYLSNELVPSPQGPTSYLPDRVHFCSGNLPSSFQSNYRQNWVPVMVPESSTGSVVSLQSSWVSPE